MTTNQPAVKDEQAKPWYAAYPVQRNAASTVTREALLSWMEKGKVSGKDFILVDLRRTDFEVSFANYSPASPNFAKSLISDDGPDFTGRDHSWINQSTCSIPLPYNSYTLYPLLNCWNN
jgi:hypothetical protein